MKRRIFSFILCCLLLVPLTARAAVFQDVQYVVDQADILTDEENIALNATAAELSAAYGMDVLVAAVEDMAGETARSYASSLNGSRSWWDTEDAILFLVAMEEREWYIATFGEAMEIFPDYVLDQLGESAILYFSDEEYFNGFAEYLSLLPVFFTSQQDGSYVYDPAYRDEPVCFSVRKTFWNVLPLSLLIGLAAAAISLLEMRSGMNTKRRQRSAADYVKEGSFDLRLHHDVFLYSNVSKTRRKQNTGSSVAHHRGGSSIHRSPGGRSHGGRGGRF